MATRLLRKRTSEARSSSRRESRDDNDGARSAAQWRAVPRKGSASDALSLLFGLECPRAAATADPPHSSERAVAPGGDRHVIAPCVGSRLAVHGHVRRFDDPLAPEEAAEVAGRVDARWRHQFFHEYFDGESAEALTAAVTNELSRPGRGPATSAARCGALTRQASAPVVDAGHAAPCTSSDTKDDEDGKPPAPGRSGVLFPQPDELPPTAARVARALGGDVATTSIARVPCGAVAGTPVRDVAFAPAVLELFAIACGVGRTVSVTALLSYFAAVSRMSAARHCAAEFAHHFLLVAAAVAPIDTLVPVRRRRLERRASLAFGHLLARFLVMAAVDVAWGDVQQEVGTGVLPTLGSRGARASAAEFGSAHADSASFFRGLASARLSMGAPLRDELVFRSTVSGGSRPDAAAHAAEAAPHVLRLVSAFIRHSEREDGPRGALRWLVRGPERWPLLTACGATGPIAVAIARGLLTMQDPDTRQRAIHADGRETTEAQRHMLTPLTRSLTERNEPLALMLLVEFGARPDFAMGNGSTPLMCAAQRHLHASMRLLLERHANVDAQRADGSTAFTLACHGPGGSAERLESMQILLDAGANPLGPPGAEVPPMVTLAVQPGCAVDELRLLLSRVDHAASKTRWAEQATVALSLARRAANRRFVHELLWWCDTGAPPPSQDAEGTAM